MLVQTLQRELPRPTVFDRAAVHMGAEDGIPASVPALREAAQLIGNEMVSLLSHDSVKYPVKVLCCDMCGSLKVSIDQIRVGCCL